MKAYHILLFLFIFNMFFWVVTEGLGIYSSPVSQGGNNPFNLSDSQNMSVWTVSVGLISRLTMFSTIVNMLGEGGAIVVLSLMLMGAAMAGYLTAGQAPQGIIYGLFGYFFWSSMGSMLGLFLQLTKGNVGAVFVIAIFGMIVSIIFVVGLFQMVTGGWKSYE